LVAEFESGPGSQAKASIYARRAGLANHRKIAPGYIPGYKAPAFGKGTPKQEAVHGSLGQRTIRQSQGQAEGRGHRPDRQQTMLKARAAGAEAIEVLIKEMREAPRASG
jgi:hypothetical protein